jgi:hypothetical protein
MSSKNVNSFSTIDTVNTYSNSSLLGIVSGNLTRLTSGNLVLNKINASNLIYNTGNQIKAGRLIIGHDSAGVVDPGSPYTLSVQSSNNNTWLEILNNSGANKGVFFGIDGNNFEQWNYQAGDIVFFTAQNVSDGYARLTIKNDGKVGIGTNSPSEKLEVDGNILANNLVYNTGNQIIFGNKSFYGNTIINNLIVTGTETIVNTSVLNIANPYLLLNISGGATDGGIFFVTGVGLTGINDSGPIIGFDHSNKFKFGISTRNSDLSPLPDIASVQEIIAYSGVADNKFATIINLASTGSTLNTKINNLSGVSVLTFGNQTISGVKTFASRPTVNGTGVLLSGEASAGQGVFITTFTHDNTNMNNNTYHFANLQALDASVISTQRRVTMMQKCKAKYASWGTYTAVAREQDSTTNQSTGYFVNNTTNMSGIISTQIRHAANATLAIFTGEITPNIDINFGDRVQLILRVPNYIIGMTGVSNSVDVTFLY